MKNIEENPNNQSIKNLQTSIGTGQKKLKRTMLNFLAPKNMLKKSWNMIGKKNLLA